MKEISASMSWKSNVIFKDKNVSNVTPDSMRKIKTILENKAREDVDRKYHAAFEENQRKLGCIQERVRKRRSGRPVSRQLLHGTTTNAAGPVEWTDEKIQEQLQKEVAAKKCQNTSEKVRPEMVGVCGWPTHDHIPETSLIKFEQPVLNRSFFSRWNCTMRSSEKDATIMKTERDDDWWRSSLRGSDQFDLNKDLGNPRAGRVRRASLSTFGLCQHKHPWGSCMDPHCIHSRPKSSMEMEKQSKLTAGDQDEPKRPASVGMDPSLRLASSDKGDIGDCSDVVED